MADLTESLLCAGDEELRAIRAELLASRQTHDNRFVQEAVAAVVADADAVRFDEAGWATVTFGGRSWAGGRFTIPTVAELRERAQEQAYLHPARGQVRLDLLSCERGPEPLADVGSLHALAEGRILFQVASQFNTLEATGPHLAPITDYCCDPTQGPRAALAGLPGLLVRQYWAPRRDGRFEQRPDRPQINLLADALPRELAAPYNGYLRTDDIRGEDRLAALDAAARSLAERGGQIRVGLHEELQVALGHAFFGRVTGERRVGQVLSSTCALGSYSRNPKPHRIPDPLKRALCQPLLDAAYRGALLAAIACGYPRVVLTLIGGGVFGNELEWIAAAIRQALAEADPLVGDRLAVLVNAHTRPEASEQLLDDVKARRGRWIHLEEDGRRRG